MAKDTITYYDNLPAGQINKGLVTKSEVYNGSEYVTTGTFGYDVYGNCIWEKDARVNDGEYGGYTSQYVYDSEYHSYIVKEINALDQTTDVVYDSLMRPAEMTDINGISTDLGYDVFGKITKFIDNGDSSTYPTREFVYNDSDNTAPTCLVVKERENAGTNNTLDSYIYFDGFGNIIQIKKETENVNQWQTIDIFYDNSGRPYKESVPYIWNGTPNNSNTARSGDPSMKYTSVEYDSIWRKIKETKPDNTFKQWVYNKKSTLFIDEKNHVSEMELDGCTLQVKKYTNEYPDQVLYSTNTRQYARDGFEVMDENGNLTKIYLNMLGQISRVDDPNRGTITFGYDANSNVISMTDAKSNTINYSYDKLNRKTLIDYPTGSDVNFYYDESGHGYGKGRLTREVYGIGNKNYSYDARGRITQISHTIDGATKTAQFNYDTLNRLTGLTYPDGEVLTKSYNSGGLLESISSGLDNYITNINYNSLSNISSIIYGNGLSATYDYYDAAAKYDPSSQSYFSYRLKEITISSGIYDIQYEYDKTGNIIKKNDLINADFSETYSYDSLYRLDNAVCTQYGTKSYGYDKINNILTKEGKTYTYNGNTFKLTNDGTHDYTYDANGNIETKTGGGINWTFEYDYENRLVSVDGKEYFYGVDYERVKKIEDGVTTRYFFPFYQEENNGTGTNIIKYYGGFARRSTNEGLIYIHNDHINSSTRVTDASGNLIKSMEYTPFGETYYTNGTAVTDKEFTGQEKDSSGLYFYGARYYDSDLGRFITPDPAFEDVNHYAYCSNNPVSYNDPSGMVKEWPNNLKFRLIDPPSYSYTVITYFIDMTPALDMLKMADYASFASSLAVNNNSLSRTPANTGLPNVSYTPVIYSSTSASQKPQVSGLPNVNLKDIFSDPARMENISGTMQNIASFGQAAVQIAARIAPKEVTVGKFAGILDQSTRVSKLMTLNEISKTSSVVKSLGYGVKEASKIPKFLGGAGKFLGAAGYVLMGADVLYTGIMQGVLSNSLVKGVVRGSLRAVRYGIVTGLGTLAGIGASAITGGNVAVGIIAGVAAGYALDKFVFEGAEEYLINQLEKKGL